VVRCGGILGLRSLFAGGTHNYEKIRTLPSQLVVVHGPVRMAVYDQGCSPRCGSCWAGRTTRAGDGDTRRANNVPRLSPAATDPGYPEQAEGAGGGGGIQTARPMSGQVRLPSVA
jgi:hypothetical protein